MLEQIKKISKQTGEAGAPTRFLYGTVTELSPLTVYVDNRFHLSGPALVSLREMFGHVHIIPKHNTQESQLHTHSLAPHETDLAQALAIGDKVILLRNQGGQEYLILGRV